MSARRGAILREMGLAPLWRLRVAGACEAQPEAAPSAPEAAVPASRPQAKPRESAAPMREHEPAPAQPVREAAPRRRDPFPAPQAARAEGPRDTHAVAIPVADAGRAARIAGMDWDTLEADIRACGACRLCEKRTQAVPGVGDRHAEWMLVGEGPGAEEDLKGEPFVGAAGKLLDAMLAAIGLKRGEGVYIANAVKCRPPHNRTPQADEIEACYPYLERQIELVRPRILVALGRPAAQALLKAEVSIGAARGRIFHYRDTPLVITYHPAYLLRNQADKAKAWEDLCFARRVLGRDGAR